MRQKMQVSEFSFLFILFSSSTLAQFEGFGPQAFAPKLPAFGAIQPLPQATLGRFEPFTPQESSDVSQEVGHEGTLSPSNLFERQTRCQPGTVPACGGCFRPGYTVCCGGGRACLTGQSCTPNGMCCNGGFQQCGARNCHNPATQVCCAPGTTSCPIGNTCVGGGCCPAGHQKCGSICYNPQTQVCCQESSTTCLKGNVCVPGGKCCPSAFPDPCGTQKCYNKAIHICCPDGKVCNSNQECFTEGCCTKGYKPCGTTRCYATRYRQECCPNGRVCSQGKCCTYGCCNTDMACGADGFCYGTKTHQLTPPPTVTPPNNGGRWSKGEVHFSYQRKNGVSNVEILKNMCYGIRKNTGKISQQMDVKKVSDAQRDLNRKNMCGSSRLGWCTQGIIEYLRNEQAKRRMTGETPMSQAELLRTRRALAEMISCDEFPIASSSVGGNPLKGVRTCVPRWQNDWQGNVLSDAQRRLGYKENDIFTIKITGFNCKTMKVDPSIRKRQDDGDAEEPEKEEIPVEPGEDLGDDLPELTDEELSLLQESIGGINNSTDSSRPGNNPNELSSLDFWPSSLDPELQLAVLPIGDWEAGTYTYTFTAPGTKIQEAFVRNEKEERLESTFSSEGEAGAIRFTVAEGQEGDLSVVVMTRQSADISVKAGKVEKGAAAGRAGTWRILGLVAAGWLSWCFV